MSYCRWSTDAFRCDLYCYESNTGYETCVAAVRPVYKITPPEFPDLRGVPKDQVGKTVLAYWMRVDELYAEAELIPIGGPHDGAYFTDSELEDFLNTLLMLREAGYNFPDYVLKNVQDEIAEAQTK